MPQTSGPDNGPANRTPGTVDFIEKSIQAAAYDLNIHMRDEGWPDLREVLRRPVELAAYTSTDYARLSTDLGVTRSMGAVGSSADNALAESFNAALKREVLQDTASWPNEPACRRQVFKWLTRYNTKRRHTWCRYQPPNAYETGYTATLATAA